MGSTADLAEPLKSRLERLLALAGGRVTVTSGRRTTAQQAALRVKNGCPDVYRAPASSCRVPTARPGESQHEKGLAADLAGDLALAARLAPQLGLATPVRGEPWHFEPAKGTFATVKDDAVGTVTDVGGASSGDGIVEGILREVRNLTVKALILTGGAVLIVAGGYRAVTGRTLSGDATRAGATAGLAYATGGASLAAGAPSATPRRARK